MSTVEVSGSEGGVGAFTDFVYGFAFAPGVLFASCVSGLYCSTDEGRTWIDLSHRVRTTLQLADQIPITAVALSPDFEHDRTMFAAVGGILLRSSDAGEHWAAARLASPEPLISGLAVSSAFATDGIVVLGTDEDGFFRSADRGVHWAAWNFGLLDLNTICLAISPDFAHDETIFIGTQSGIFRSTNGGRAWREIELPVGYAAILSLTPSPAYAQDRIILAGTETGILLQSSDGGESWQQLHSFSETPINGIVLAPDYANTQQMLLNIGSGLLLSRDNGVTWTDYYADQINGEVSAVNAPWGLSQESSLLVGFVGGRICRLSPSALARKRNG